MSQRHGYLYKVNIINALGYVTFFFNNVTQRHTFFKKCSIIKTFKRQRTSH